MTKVVIIEDNQVLANIYKNIIQSNETYKVIGVFNSFEQVENNSIFEETQIVLMDITLPGINGVEATKIIKKNYPSVNIIMITVHENSTMVFDALCAGAIGYLTKNIEPDYLITALDECLQGGAPMSIKIAKMVVKSFQKKSSILLSDREKEVLQLLSQGNTYHAIAESLSISKNTIKFHLKNIYIKLQVQSNVDAVQKALRENLI
ncbi:response regulator transcription factor [Polaribacter sp.]|uniref:response regulator transcription factor n=1 Tax=Polaribacter sp. TaxID=1920175 RepID=UPI004048DF64